MSAPAPRSVLRAAGALALCIGALFLGRIVAPEAAVYRDILSDFALRALASAIEVSTLLGGAFYAHRAARRFGPRNPMRVPWLGFTGWLFFFGVAQVILSSRQILLRVPTPLPSEADLALALGYVSLGYGVWSFRRVYRATGFAVGQSSFFLVVSLVAGAALVNLVAMIPIASAHRPLVQRIVNILFPTADLTVLVLTGLLLHTVLPLRAGRVWRILALLLASIATACVGDILFAYFYFYEWNELESLVNFLFMLSYGCGALAAWLQGETLKPIEPDRGR